MPARKDDGQKPPEGGRRGVIWRLPATRDADDSANASAATEAEPPRRGRRVPVSVVAGLSVALVLVGLYAAWSEVGRDMLSESQAPESAVVPAPAAQAVDPSGDGAAGAGAATPPSGDGAGAPLVIAEADADDAGGAAPAEDSAPVVASGAGVEADAPPQAAEPVVVAGESASAASVVDEAAPKSAPAAASASDDETTSDRAAAEIGADAGVDMSAAAVAAASVDDAPLPLADVPTVASAAADADALGVLQARLDALESAAAGAPGAEAAVEALEQRIRALEDDPARAQLDRALAAWDEQRAAQDAALAEMAARLASFEATAAQQAAADGHLVSLVLATGELTAALGSFRPYAPALDGLSAIAGEDAEIESVVARLAPFAATGVPTLDGLRARFPQAANAIVRAAPAADDADWIDETVTKLSQLVTIRRTGGAIDPASLDGRLAGAEAALAAGDLALAIAVVETVMPGSAEAESAHAWLGDARARREADAALAGLAATVRARIGARWTEAGAPP